MNETKQILCDVIRDLLPSYVEQLTGSETNELVEQHLADCEECRKVVENMKNNEKMSPVIQGEEKAELDFLKKNKKRTRLIVWCSIVAAVLVICGAIIYAATRPSSYFIVDNGDDGVITVTAQNAAKGSSGIGYITIAEGQEMEVRTNLTDNSSITIEVLPANVDATTKVLMEETFTAINADFYELPAGDYTIRITAKKGANGDMTIKASGESDAGDNTASAAN